VRTPSVTDNGVRASSRALKASPWIVAAIALVALSLRGPIVAPAPIIRLIQSDTGLSATVAGLLTSLPVLLFGLGAPLAERIIRRAGAETSVVICLAGVLLGTAIRSAGGTGLLMAGTLVIGAAVAIGNVVIPVVIRRDVPPAKVAAVTGGYAAALNIGSMLTSLGTAPLADAVGWRWALVIWGVLTLAGLGFWFAAGRHSTPRSLAPSGAGPASEVGPASEAGPASGVAEAQARPRLGALGWLLLIAFSGQAMAYYTVTAWLPTLLGDERGLSGNSAGSIASLFQIAAVVGAIWASWASRRTAGWVNIAVIGTLWLILPLGLLAAPGWYPVWAIVGGIAQGGGFTAIFTIIAHSSRSHVEVTTMSARVQTGGYLAAAAGPPLAGALHSATGSWTPPMLLVLAATLAFLTMGLAAAARSTRPAAHAA
jgi:CP family cyanate transporter-like MFS transporter